MANLTTLYRRLPFAAALALLLACSATDQAPSLTEADLSAIPARNWTTYPAIVQLDSADEIYALSDAHGGYEALGSLLQVNQLVSGFSKDPAKVDQAKWIGGSALLVVAGDLIDKGAESLGVIDLLRSLQKQATASGGRVVVTLGNHEAEFFADPNNRKATSSGTDSNGVDNELAAQNINPTTLAHGKDAAGRGAWLLNLPFAARVKKWFFSHSGDTNGDSLDQLEKRLSQSVDKNGYGDNNITGKNSILESQGWYGNPDKDTTAAKYCDALGVKHIVFGHDPGAFGEHGHILANKDGTLIKLDVQMGLQASSAVTGGLLLHVRTQGTDTAEVLDARGKSSPLL